MTDQHQVRDGHVPAGEGGERRAVPGGADGLTIAPEQRGSGKKTLDDELDDSAE